LYDGTATNVTYAYDGTAANVTYQEATNFSPDLIWIKNRDSSGENHQLTDIVSGFGKVLYSNLTIAQVGSDDSYYTEFSNGFSVNTANNNISNNNYAAWCFNAGTDAAASNTDGSINSTVKANQDAGFSIVKYTAGGTATVGHGLSQAPELIITKNLDTSEQWFVYAEPVGTQKFLGLNTTSAATSNSGVYTNIGSSTFTNNISSTSRTYINYCFHSVDGFQKVGSYTGNGSANGTIVETEFEPAFVMIKRTDGTAGNWFIFDNKRSAVNERDDFLHPNSSAAETTNSAAYSVDFLSNGFQIKGIGDQINGNNGTHIYLAIAADPDTTTPTVENSFDVVTYTGNDSTQDIETDFKPDLVWIKRRTSSEPHAIYDSIRGINKQLSSDSAGAEATNSSPYEGFTAFNDNGFTVGNNGGTNRAPNDYVAWCWKAGDHDDNLPQINTEGTIDSVVSVNDAAGFSIVKYTGTGSASDFGHGLSSAPELIIIKNLDDGTRDWIVHPSSQGDNKYLILNGTNAINTSSIRIQSVNSTVVNIGTNTEVNANGQDFICYCFTSITGYQKVGSYSGSNSPITITTGFQPRFVLIKRTDTSGNSWVIIDSVRGIGSGADALFPDLSAAESSGWNTDFISTGFTISSNESYISASGGTYIYLAIA
jgi:hypothetical protein